MTESREQSRLFSFATQYWGIRIREHIRRSIENQEQQHNREKDNVRLCHPFAGQTASFFEGLKPQARDPAKAQSIQCQQPPLRGVLVPPVDDLLQKLLHNILLV